MKVRVINHFYDKHTGNYCPVNSVLEMTPERFAELEQAGNFVVKLAEAPAEQVQNSIEHTEPDAKETPEVPAEPPKKSSRRSAKK